MHHFHESIYFEVALYMFRTVFPSVIRCLRLTALGISQTDTADCMPEGTRWNCRQKNLCDVYLKLYRAIQNDCRGTIVQRKFRTKLGKQPQYDNSVRRRYAQFQETGCVCIPELKVRIRTAIETITADMLQRVWNELDYRFDVCRITKGAHIEHL